MNFVEKLLGISPDNGTGVFELTIVLVVAMVVALVVIRRGKMRVPWR